MFNSHREAALSLNADGRMAGGRRWSPVLAAGLLAVAAASVAALAVLGASEMPDASAQQGAACSEGMESIMKNADGSMACVSPGTKAVLIERGWGSEPMPDMMEGAPDEMAALDDGSADMGVVDDMDAIGSDAMGDSVMMDGPPMPDMPTIDLTDAESARLTGEIRVAYDPYRFPVEFDADPTAGLYDDGFRLGGASGAYLEWIDAVLPADFVPVDKASLEGEPGAPIRPYEAVANDVADVVMAIEATDELGEYMSFTEPHTTLPIVMATTDGSMVEVDSLSGMNVGAVSGYGAARWLDSTSIDHTKYATGIEAIKALDAGDIDVFVGLWAVAFNSAMISETPVAVTNAGETGQSEMLSIGYAASDAELGSALGKGLASMPDEMRTSITAMLTIDPAEAFGSPEALAETFGDDETASSLIAMGDEIDDLNRSAGAIEEKLGSLPEAQAFTNANPGHTSRFDDSGYAEATLTLRAAGDDSSLQIEYSKETETVTLIYMCTDSDGNTQSHHSDNAGDNMASIIAGECTEPDFG